MSWGSPNDQQSGTGGGQGAGGEPLFILAGLIAVVFVAAWVAWLAGAVTALVCGHGWHGKTAGSAVPFAWSLVRGRSAAAAWAGLHAGALGPVPVFWVVLVLLAAAVLVPAVMLMVRYRGSHRPHLGAQWARRDQERSMVVPDDHPKRPYRLTAGRSELTNRLLAGADCMSATAFGPNGSGKTVSLVVPNALEWQGPAAITTAKGPDVEYMLTARQGLGPVYIVAPTGLPGQQTARWSPVAYCTDQAAAARMARWLCEAAAMEDPSSKPWVTQAKQFIGPLLLAANWSGKGIDAFVDFVQRGKAADAEVRDMLKSRGAQEFLRQYSSVWQLHPDGVGSVLFTANTLIDPYLNPTIRASAADSDFTAEDILSSNGTLFIVSPPSESKALAPLFTALLLTLVYAVEREYERINVGRPPGTKPRPLEPRLLLNLDEAGNVFKYPGLAQLSSTARGMGIQLLTIWHDLAQLEGLYGEHDARTIISQAKTRMILPGLGDDSTLEYFSKSFGDTVRKRASVTTGSDGRGSSTTNSHESPLIAAYQLRELARGHAVIQYDNLPPMKIELRNAETDKHLQALANGSALIMERIA